jgi:hypothetical protein
MSTPIVPPYFGSYEEIVNALLHKPFYGSVELNPQPLPPREDPQPSPWRNAAVRYLATIAGMHELAQNVSDQALREQLNASAEAAIQAFIEDYCGTPPRRIPWHWPGPPPWVTPLAGEVISAANTQTGALREGLLRIAGRIAAVGLGGIKATGVPA